MMQPEGAGVPGVEAGAAVTLDLSCCVLSVSNVAWLAESLRAHSSASFRGCVMDTDSVDNHSAFVLLLANAVSLSRLEWLDVRGLRPSPEALVSFVASLAHAAVPMRVAVGAVPKSLGLALLARCAPKIALGFGAGEDLVFVAGRRKDFAAVAEAVKANETGGAAEPIPGVRRVDQTPDAGAKGSTAVLARPKKPWEK